MGLVTLACGSCVTIVAVPIKLQYFKNYENHDAYSCNHFNGHKNGELMITSSVVKEVGAQFMGYKKGTNVISRTLLKCNIFGILLTGFGKSLYKVLSIFCL